MCLDFCASCGRWCGSQEGVIRQGKDNEPEIICNECIANEQKPSASSPIDMSDTKLVSTERINWSACGAS